MAKVIEEEASMFEDSDLAQPNWGDGGPVHNWQNYIKEKLRAIWHSFTIEQKRILAENAQEIADQEEWD